MTYRLRFTLYLVLSLAVLPVSAQVGTIQEKIDQLLKSRFYEQATIGISVYDLTAGKTVYHFNEKKLCRPASNMKILTSATALQYLTPSYEFRTELFHDGAVDSEGTLTGNLYLKGGFDPEFSTTDLDTIAASLAKKGIRRINGKLFIDVSMVETNQWGKAWSWDDDLEAFQPYLSPIPINKGSVKLSVIPASPSKPPIVRLEPDDPFIQITNLATTVWKSSLPAKKTLVINRYLEEGQNKIEISGHIGARSPSYKTMVSLQNPAGYVLSLLYERLRTAYPESTLEKGGTSVTPVKTQLIGYTSHSLPDIIYCLNKESDNLNAEMVLFALGYQDGKLSSTEKGIKMIQQMIRQMGLDDKRYNIVDGSGLSNQNYLSPELILEFLKYMYHTPDFELFRNTLPVSGKDGTLVNRMKESHAYRKITAKTGSLTGVSTLSGYVTTGNHHLLAFSIMVQNFVEKTSVVSSQYIDRICDILAE